MLRCTEGYMQNSGFFLENIEAGIPKAQTYSLSFIKYTYFACRVNMLKWEFDSGMA